MPKVHVSAVCLRGHASEEAVPPVSLRLVTETITVRELIERSVAKQVESLAAELAENPSRGMRRFELQYLSEAELVCRSVLGGGSPCGAFDSEQAIGQALEGFRHHAFKVIVDGKAQTDLGGRLQIEEGTEVSFVRVVPSVVH